MNETQSLARWVAETAYEDLPSEVVEAVRIFIIDDLASGFAGAKQPWTDMVGAMERESSVGNCSLFGRDWTTSASAAALINGVAIGGFETDHPYTQGSCHPGGAVFPAVLAAAESSRIDGRQFIAAIATGYEVLCRIGLAATRAVEDERGYHGPATNAALGAAFGAGKALGLPAETLTQAAGIAGSHGGGLLEFFREGAMTKRLHLGRGAQMGLESAQLAQRGFTGPSTVLEGDHGFLRVYSPAPKPELLLQDLGDDYRLLGMTLKAYPCHMSFQAVVDAIQRFKETQPIDPALVDAVSITSASRMAESRFQDHAPTSLMGAQYSLPWSTAHALCRDAMDPASWNEATLADAQIRAIAAGVDVRETSPSTAGAAAEIELTMAGQRHLIVATDWKGAPTRPYSFDGIAEKLARYAKGSVSETQVEELVDLVGQLESEPDISLVGRLIRSR